MLYANCAKLLEKESKRVATQELAGGTKEQIKLVITHAASLCEANKQKGALPDKVSTLLAMALEVRTRQEDYQNYQDRPRDYQVKWGKHSGHSLEEVLQDREYVKWLLRNRQRCQSWEAKILLHHVDGHFVLSGKELQMKTALDSAMEDWTQNATAETAMEERVLAKIQTQLDELVKARSSGT
eukprot:1333303-Amphidinium_carterae.1